MQFYVSFWRLANRWRKLFMTYCYDFCTKAQTHTNILFIHYFDNWSKVTAETLHCPFELGVVDNHSQLRYKNRNSFHLLFLSIATRSKKFRWIDRKILWIILTDAHHTYEKANSIKTHTIVQSIYLNSLRKLNIFHCFYLPTPVKWMQRQDCSFFLRNNCFKNKFINFRNQSLSIRAKGYMHG